MSALSKHISVHEIAEPTWPETCKAEVDAILAKYPDGQERSAVLPLLHLSMREREGHFVAVSDMQAIAEICGVSPAYVDSVASFYAMYHRHPIGKYLITVCGSMVCQLLAGGKTLYGHIEESLGIKNGQTTADGLFTIEFTNECLAACDLGPVLHFNTEYAVKVTPEKFDEIVAHLRGGGSLAEKIEKLPLMCGHDQDQFTAFKTAEQFLAEEGARKAAAEAQAAAEAKAAAEAQAAEAPAAAETAKEGN
ncbi:MAG TPA: NAD(P)H-dependent oxidoreductase subunit E [Symbiobacteriaceae bacterium]|nr:NAD(P)H-dependent oxidoreductase subunit E [Symbiobacteriaceae bacterium]